MIVGNGSLPEGAAATIDAADRVIRFNECGNFGAAGSRTDVIAVCNTGRPAKAMLSGDWSGSPAVQAATEIWSVRDPDKFREMREALERSHPELDDFCDDYSRGFSDLAAARSMRHRILSRHVHEAVDEALQGFHPDPYVSPSSGMIVIADILADPACVDDEIVLAGFTHEGWHGHPFAAERRLIDSFVAAGKLARLKSPNLSSPSQGD
ncbi:MULTISPECIES: Urease operon accessory protein [Alphaproteobacteria]|nr:MULTISPECIES: Urease operon accessory protein [Alphaproteobacteria]